MPQNPVDKPQKYLSKKAFIQYQRFLDSLSFLQAGFPYLALIGVSHSDLGESIILDLEEILPHYSLAVDLTTEQDIYRLFLSKMPPPQPVLLIPMYRATHLDNSRLAAQLIFNRDNIVRFNLQMVLVVEDELFDTIQREAYDFLFVANFAQVFADQSKSIHHDLQGTEVDSEDWQHYLRQKKQFEDYEKSGKFTSGNLLGVLIDYASSAFRVSRLDESLDLFRQALEVAQQEGDREMEARSLVRIALIYRTWGDLPTARQYLEKAKEIFAEIKDESGLGSSLSNLGIILSDMGLLEDAIKNHTEALGIYNRLNHPIGKADNLNNLGLIFKEQGKFKAALQHFNQALAIDREAGYHLGEAINLGNIGIVYRALGELDQAVDFHRKALQLHRRTGFFPGQANQLGNLG